MIVVPLYARLVNAFPRLRLIRVVTWFFVACLVGFYVLARAGVPLGIIYFLWIGIFNLMIVAQFWGFANDLYTKDEGERLFPIVGFGASLGAVLGSLIAGWLIAPLGVYQMMLVGAVGLVLQVQITAYIDRRERGRAANQSAKETGCCPRGASGIRAQRVRARVRQPLSAVHRHHAHVVLPRRCHRRVHSRKHCH
jgi:ATP:ADP antiporter, AAA family